MASRCADFPGSGSCLDCANIRKLHDQGNARRMATASIGFPPLVLVNLAESSLTEAQDAATSRSLLTEESQRTVVLPLRDSFLQFRVTGEEPKWFYPTLACFRKLLKLRAGWDSYRASVITNEAIAGAAKVLVHLQPPLEAPQPNVVPGSSGSVQLEWHKAGLDVEIHVSSAGNVTAFLSTEGGEYEFETIDHDTADRLGKVLSRMAP